MRKQITKSVFIVVLLIGAIIAALMFIKSKTTKKVICENTTKELTVYENTALVLIKDRTNEKKNKPKAVAKETEQAANEPPDITDVGSMYTVEQAVSVPTIVTENTDITYFSPYVYSGDVKKVAIHKVTQTSKDGSPIPVDTENEKATKAELGVTYNDKKTSSDNFIFYKAGTYDVAITIKVTDGTKIKDTLKVTVQPGSINDDYVSGTSPLSNIMVNAASAYMTSLSEEYKTEIPFAIANYKSSVKSEEKAKQAFLKDNAVMLLDFNRVRKWCGEDILDINGIFTTYGTEEALQAASAKSGSDEYNGFGRITTRASSKAKQAFDLVNQKRAEVGSPALAWSDIASKGAEIRAREIVSNFSHDSASGARDGCSGENIAYGQPSASAVVTDWYNSEGHRRNMLDASFTSGAIACYERKGICYWVQLFVR